MYLSNKTSSKILKNFIGNFWFILYWCQMKRTHYYCLHDIQSNAITFLSMLQSAIHQLLLVLNLLILYIAKDHCSSCKYNRTFYPHSSGWIWWFASRQISETLALFAVQYRSDGTLRNTLYCSCATTSIGVRYYLDVILPQFCDKPSKLCPQTLFLKVDPWHKFVKRHQNLIVMH